MKYAIAYRLAPSAEVAFSSVTPRDLQYAIDEARALVDCNGATFVAILAVPRSWTIPRAER